MLRRLLLCGLIAVEVGMAQPLHAADATGIAVVVARGGGPVEPDRRELALIFSRKKRFWGDGQRIVPVNLPAGHPLRRAFSQSVLGHSPEELDEYWREQYFHGELPPFVVSSEEAAIRFVTNTPGAIAYVYACQVDKRVTVLLVVDAGLPCPH